MNFRNVIKRIVQYTIMFALAYIVYIIECC